VGEGSQIEIPLEAASIYLNTISRTNLNHAMPRVYSNVVQARYCQGRDRAGRGAFLRLTQDGKDMATSDDLFSVLREVVRCKLVGWVSSLRPKGSDKLSTVIGRRISPLDGEICLWS
jgi:hypothetical protein